MVISPSRRLDSRKDSKSKDPLRIWRSKKRTYWRKTSRRIIRSPGDDVTPGYDLHMNDKPEIFFLSAELKIDTSRLKSIWGLMLRI